MPLLKVPHSPLSPLHLGPADCSTSTFSSSYLAAKFFRAGAKLYIGLEPSGKRSPRLAVSGAVGEAPSGLGGQMGVKLYCGSAPRHQVLGACPYYLRCF